MVKTVSKKSGRALPPPLIQAMPERKHFFFGRCSLKLNYELNIFCLHLACQYLQLWLCAVIADAPPDLNLLTTASDVREKMFDPWSPLLRF